MQPQDPEVWRLIVWLSANQIWIYAGVLSFAASILRVFIDHQSLQRRDVAEAILCMLFVSVSKPFMEKMGLTDDWAFPVGLFVGYAGTAYLKPFILGVFKAFRETRGMK